MKAREIKELKARPSAELEKLVKESNERLRALRLDLAAGKVKNVQELRALRKDVARMRTFLRARRSETA